jgi:MFS transporter, DHA1 family, tetracycline resistance protein
MKKPSLLVIFLTVFLDLVGFGIVLPLLPIFAKTLAASGLVIGLLMASFSAMQFIFAPVWGRLSDRIGRRPVLLVSTAGSAISYAIFAVGSGQTGQAALVLLFVSRAFAGICGANITVAQAYIADITPPEERSKKMGLVGMAFGLGFIFGPALGGLGLKFGGITAPGWIAAALCGVNFLFAFARLPESWQPGANAVAQRPRWEQVKHTLQRPGIGLLVLVFFLATFSFACFETTLGLLVSLNFGLKFETIKGVVHTFDDKVMYLYTFCGLVGALVQGGPLGRAVKKFGEPTLIALSLGLVALSLGVLPFVKTWPLLIQPHPPAGVWDAFPAHARRRAGGNFGRGAKCRQPRAHLRPHLRRDAVRRPSLMAVSGLRGRLAGGGPAGVGQTARRAGQGAVTTRSFRCGLVTNRRFRLLIGRPLGRNQRNRTRSAAALRDHALVRRARGTGAVVT